MFSIEGGFCGTQARCTHRQGPLSEGSLDGSTVTCPLHGAQFNVWTGAVLRGPARDPLTTYSVTVEGEAEIVLRRSELQLRKHGWIAFGQPRGPGVEVVEFFIDD